MAGIRSLADLAERRDATGVEFLQLLEPARHYLIPPPRLHFGADQQEQLAWNDLFLAKVNALSPAAALYRLHGVFITPNSAVMTFAGAIVRESLYPYMNPPDIVAAFAPFLHPLKTGPEDDLGMEVCNTTRIRQATFYARDHGEAGYFHWLHSVLPRAVLYRDVGLSDLTLNVAAGSEVQRSSLARIGWNAGQLTQPNGNTLVCDELVMSTPMVVPDLARSGGFFERSLAATRILKGFARKDLMTAGQRLFISRADSKVRRLLNEAEIVQLLEPLGFESHVLSGMSFDQQVELFEKAECVISMHGAGLSNIAFMPDGAKVLEILSPDRLWPTYRGVAARAKLDYFPYVGRRAGVTLHNDSDIELDAAQFRAFVGAMLEL